MESANTRKVSCVANYAYEASEADELSLRAGDVVRDVERLPGGWWRGELRGRRGMFPDNFVTVLSEHSATNSHRSSGVSGKCRAVFSYQPANPDELPLCVGDELEVVGEVEEGWWQGRRHGRLGVFPSNFVVMIAGDPPAAATPDPPFEPAPALPPKPVKELCRVLFPYAAVNEDELTLHEGDVVTLLSREAPDRGWWRGELRGRQGLFPDNFVMVLPSTGTPPAHPTNTTHTPVPDAEEKKSERPLSKGISLPKTVLNKYSEKTSSLKELTTAKLTSTHKDSSENVTHRESTVTHTNKSDSEKSAHSETLVDGAQDGQGKKPPVPMKKSPTPTSGVGGILGGLKNKILSTSDKDKSNPSLSSSTSASNSTSSGEWDRPDGGGGSKPATTAAAAPNANTFDHIERNSILNDPRAGRVKAPRRRPPSQVLRDDVPQQLGLSNGQHDANVEKPEKPPPEKAEEIKPKSREWEKHRAPWMEELKLNQAKKTNLISEVGKSRSVSEHSAPLPNSAAKATGSTDRILDCGLEEKKSTHSMEMSRSTSSISSRISALETFEETKIRHSLDSKKDASPAKEPEVVVVVRAAPAPASAPPPAVHSPTAAGRTFSTMVEEVKKPPAPAPPVTAPPVSSVRTSLEPAAADRLVNSLNRTERTNSLNKTEKTTTEKHADNVCNFIIRSTASNDSKCNAEKVNHLDEKPHSNATEKSLSTSTLERRATHTPGDKDDAVGMLISQLNDRISNLEKLLEVQNAKFNAALEELRTKLSSESGKRLALQAEVEKLSHCVTQV